MRNRNLLTNIFSIVIILALIAFMLATFGILPGAADKAGTVSYYVAKICLPLALAAVACMDIVLPLLDNRRKLAEKSYLLKVIVKVFFFLAAVMVLVLRNALHIESQVLALVLFIIFYLAQFFINLDPRQPVSPDYREPEERVLPEEEDPEDEVEFTRLTFSEKKSSSDRIHEYDDDDDT